MKDRPTEDLENAPPEDGEPIVASPPLTSVRLLIWALVLILLAVSVSLVAWVFGLL